MKTPTDTIAVPRQNSLRLKVSSSKLSSLLKINYNIMFKSLWYGSSEASQLGLKQTKFPACCCWQMWKTF